MNKFLKFMPVVLLAAATMTFTACSDDDDVTTDGKPTTNNVFTNAYPTDIDGAKVSRNGDGQVTKIEDDYSTVTFEYGTFNPSRAHNYTVLMKIREIDDENNGSDIYMELNKQGFVSYAYQIDLDGDTDEWFFGYNSDGQLNSFKRTEGSESYTVTYTNGDITRVVKTEDDGDTSEYTIAYTNSTNTSAVANKGCLMLFDDTFGIDMDEMEIAYYAGLIGKATKNLPMGYTRKSVEGGSTYTDNVVFHWQFDKNGYPTKFWEDDYSWEATSFTW